MSALNDALQQVGVDLGRDAASNLIGAIGDFNRQNLSPDGQAIANAGLRILSQATGIGALSPGIAQRGTGGVWESVHYADDLNKHHPKFKFLFKVNFKGFPGGDFSYFVHRCDKPKVKFNHTDVNYYNFRTKVLTSVSYEPLSFTFLDEIGNTVNSFFSMYVAQRSMQGNGRASIIGGKEYSSSIPYDNGYSSGRSVEIQQIFANGVATNIFTLVNARIDSLEFDELNMEQTLGSLMACTVSYDAITCITTGPYTINSWGQTDLYRGGGTSGPENAGQTSTGPLTPTSAIGGGIGGNSNFITAFANDVSNLVGKILPPSLQNLPGSMSTATPPFNQPTVVQSNGSILSSSIQSTLDSITSGSNLRSGGLSQPEIDLRMYSDNFINGSSLNNPNSAVNRINRGEYG